MNRRALLRGMGGAAIALPYLEIMMPKRMALAQAGAISKVGANGRPKRFVLIYTPNGAGDGWWDNKVGPDGKLVLGPVMAPLEAYKDDLLLIDGLALRTSVGPGQFNAGTDGGHERPHLHITSCMPIQNRMNGGISIDQAIANGIAGDTKIKSLSLTVRLQGDSYDALSYTAAKAPIPPMIDPALVFKKLFTDFQTDPAVYARVQAKRQSILDNVKKNYEGFVATLGGDDQQKVRNHLDGIRQLEAGLTKKQMSGGAGGGVCAVPVVPAKAADKDALGRQMYDLITLAFACDLTRVATLNTQWMEMPWLGIRGGSSVHDISHGPSGPRDRLATWNMGYISEFFDKLKKAEDGPGARVWDNMVFCQTTEHGCGNHNNDRMPFLVAGSAGGYFKTGRILKFPLNFMDPNQFGNGFYMNGPGHGELYTSFLNAMGIPAVTFGQPEFCRGPLPGMV